MAMMYGLNNVDSNCPQSYIDTINLAFEAIKKQYNISYTDLNTFNRFQFQHRLNQTVIKS